MNTITGKDGNIITKEKIDKAFGKAAQDYFSGIISQYGALMDEMPDKYRNEAIAREIITATAAQSNAFWAVKQALCEIFGIEDTPEPGTAEN